MSGVERSQEPDRVVLHSCLLEVKLLGDLSLVFVMIVVRMVLRRRWGEVRLRYQ